MKRLPLLIKSSLALSVITLIMTIGDFLALNDIWHDYVSRQVIESVGDNVLAKLPAWSETKLEWRMVQISELTGLLYLLISSFTLMACLKILKHRDKT